MAARNGYVRQEYGQKSLSGQGTILSVSAGQQIRDLALRLIPAPTISGRVIGANREPQPGITVQLRVVDGGHNWETWRPTFVEGVQYVFQQTKAARASAAPAR